MNGSVTTCAFKPGTLLVCFVGRNKGERLVNAAKQAGARGGTLALGKTQADNRFLQACCLADMQQDIVLILLGAERRAVTEAVKAAALDKKLEGIAVTLDVSDILFRPDGAEQALQQETEREIMESGHKLITVIVNNGYAEDAMAVARQAGAKGGTILTARGTGTEEDVKFFGITLVPEKDMLMIVAAKNIAPAIMKAVSGMPGLCEPGGGIIYSMNVEEFITLGK